MGVVCDDNGPGTGDNWAIRLWTRVSGGPHRHSRTQSGAVVDLSCGSFVPSSYSIVSSYECRVIWQNSLCTFCVAALFAVIGMPIALQYTGGVTYVYFQDSSYFSHEMGPSGILSITA